MRYESGRSLIEIVGVIAIGAVMTAAAIGMYRTTMARLGQNLARQLAKTEKMVKMAKTEKTA